MPSRQKVKGNKFERDVVNLALAHDPDAIRARGSDGRSIGREAEVDVVIFDHGWSCKIRKRIAQYLYPPQGCLGTIIREDRGEPHVVVPLAWVLETLEKLEDGN